MVVRIVVAEDSLLVREGIEKLLGKQDDIEIVALCVDLPELLAAVEAHHPDAVLTDIRMPPNNSDEGIVAATTLRELHPEVGVVVLSQYVEPTYALQLFDGGSQGRAYLLKEGLRLIFQMTHEHAVVALQRWLVWARRCQIPAFIELAAKITRHRDSILVCV